MCPSSSKLTEMKYPKLPLPTPPKKRYLGFPEFSDFHVLGHDKITFAKDAPIILSYFWKYVCNKYGVHRSRLGRFLFCEFWKVLKFI